MSARHHLLHFDVVRLGGETFAQLVTIADAHRAPSKVALREVFIVITSPSTQSLASGREGHAGDHHQLNLVGPTQLRLEGRLLDAKGSRSDPFGGEIEETHHLALDPRQSYPHPIFVQTFDQRSALRLVREGGIEGHALYPRLVDYRCQPLTQPLGGALTLVGCQTSVLGTHLATYPLF